MKAYFLMRQDLEMSPAKLAVQIGHGTDLIHTRHVQHHISSTNFDEWAGGDDPFTLVPIPGRMANYRRKIVLRVKSEDQLNKLMEKLLDDNIWPDIIKDIGFTEFDGETVTGLVIHPISDERVPKYIKRLQLYK